MGVGGSIPNWQFGEIGAWFGMFLLLFPLLSLASKPRGERFWSKTSVVIFLLTVFTGSMIAVYVVSSKPYYVARNRFAQSFELVEDATGLQVTEDTNTSRIITVLAENNTVRIWPPNCIRGRLHAGGNAQFDGPITLELREAIAVALEDDGFEVRRAVFEEERWSIVAIRGNQSYHYTQYPDGLAGIVSRVDSRCDNTSSDGWDECTDCVESFLGEPD